jgi:hypothetical protein
MLSTILIVFLLLLLFGEASVRRPVAARSAATRKRRASR